MSFDTPVQRRGTGSLKWERDPEGVLPFWVADMDFASPPAVIDAVRTRAEHGVFGYTIVPESLKRAIVEYIARRYGWEVEREWLVWLPSLVTGLTLSCASAGGPGDEVMAVTPVYPPFLSAPLAASRRLLRVPAECEEGRWRLPLAAMERAVTRDTRVLLLCHPHNPLGRAWDAGELAAVTDFCRRHQLVLCSDEIHCDLVLDDRDHLPAAVVAGKGADFIITLMSPSKAYNLPGLNFAFAVIPDPALRARFETAGKGLLPYPGCFAIVAAEAAYRNGGDWLGQLLDYLRGNRDMVEQFIAASLPGAKMTHVEATYLAWIDVSPIPVADPVEACLKAGVALSPGAGFGNPGYLRLNFACPRSLLVEGLERMARALT